MSSRSSDSEALWSSSDIALAAGQKGNAETIYKAVTRLMRAGDADVRVIAAQALVENSFAKADLIKGWIINERCSEVRGWLYLALATIAGPEESEFLDSIVKKRSIEVTDEEALFLNAALAISHKSRIFLLNVMRGIFNRDESLSKTASMLCRMLIAEGADAELKFTEILERERFQE